MLKFKLCILLLTASVYAQSSFLFLKVPTNAKVSALCESVSATIENPASFVYNPSTLMSTTGTNLLLDYIHYFENVCSLNTTITRNSGKIALGLSFKYFKITDEVFDIYINKIGEIEHFYIATKLGIAIKIEKNIYSGINIGYASQDITYMKKYFSSTNLLDIGILIVKRMNFYAFSITNVPLAMRFGISHIEDKYKVSIDATYELERAVNISGGLELKFLFLNLISGVSYRFARDLNFAFGIEYEHKKFSIQYGLTPKLNLGISHTFSFQYKL